MFISEILEYVFNFSWHNFRTNLVQLCVTVYFVCFFLVLWMCPLMECSFCSFCVRWSRNMFSFLKLVCFLQRFLLHRFFTILGRQSTNRLSMFHSSLTGSVVCTAEVCYFVIWIKLRTSEKENVIKHCVAFWNVAIHVPFIFYYLFYFLFI